MPCPPRPALGQNLAPRNLRRRSTELPQDPSVPSDSSNMRDDVICSGPSVLISLPSEEAQIFPQIFPRVPPEGEARSRNPGPPRASGRLHSNSDVHVSKSSERKRMLIDSWGVGYITALCLPAAKQHPATGNLPGFQIAPRNVGTVRRRP